MKTLVLKRLKHSSYFIAFWFQACTPFAKTAPKPYKTNHFKIERQRNLQSTCPDVIFKNSCIFELFNPLPCTSPGHCMSIWSLWHCLCFIRKEQISVWLESKSSSFHCKLQTFEWQKPFRTEKTLDDCGGAESFPFLPPSLVHLSSKKTEFKKVLIRKCLKLLFYLFSVDLWIPKDYS